MSTKNPFFVSPPSDYQQFGSGKFLISYAGVDIKISLNGGTNWQKLPEHIDFGLGSSELYAYTTPNTNTHEVTVPTSEIWQIEQIYYTHSATATSGTRKIATYLMTDQGNGTPFAVYKDELYITASEEKRFILANGLPLDTSYRESVYAYRPFSPVAMSEGESIKIYDQSNIDSNDDLNIWIKYRRLDQLKTKDINIFASDLLISWTDSIANSTEQIVHVLKLD